MSEEELKVWFFNKFNSCYQINNKYYYDDSFIRKQKLCRLNNEELTLPSTVTGVCLFEHNFNNMTLTCNYTEIWKFLENNYKDDYDKIQLLIKSCLKENDKLSGLTPKTKFFIKW